MKKIYLILWTVIITLLVVCTTFEIKQNKKTKEEIKRLEKIIELKQEINKEYVYLFKETENKNLKQEINDKQIKIEEAAKTIENLQTTINERQQENQNIKEEIDIKQQELNRIIEERRQIEEQRRLEQIRRIEASTVKIETEITYSQFPNYPTGCESIALKILLEYNGIYTSGDEIIDRLKKGQLPYKIEDEMYGGNPEIEFIGDPRNDYSYGVYNTPIAEVASTFKGNVQNREGMELEEINLIKQNVKIELVIGEKGGANREATYQETIALYLDLKAAGYNVELYAVNQDMVKYAGEDVECIKIGYTPKRSSQHETAQDAAIFYWGLDKS